MMKTNCIQHPTQERLLIIREWQVEFCSSNYCAAALLSFYEYWYNIKLEISQKNQRSNDIAEMHGDTRTQDESLWQFHNLDELSEGIIGLFSKNTITKANTLLEELGVITLHKNPNPRYTFDKTNYFEFHPEICNDWLNHQYKNANNVDGKSPSFKNNLSCPKIESRSPNIALSNPRIGTRHSKNGIPYPKSELTITEITTEISTETTDKLLLANQNNLVRLDNLSQQNFQKLNSENHTDNFPELIHHQTEPNQNLNHFPQEQKTSLNISMQEANALTEKLMQQGLPITPRLNDPRDFAELCALHQLLQIHPEHLAIAMHKAKTHAKKDFGIRYLLTIIKQLSLEETGILLDEKELKKKQLQQELNIYLHEYHAEEEASLHSPMAKHSDFVESCHTRMQEHAKKITEIQNELNILFE